MRLARYEHDGKTRLGVLVDDGVVSIEGAGCQTMRAIVEASADGLARVRAFVGNKQPDLRLSDIRLLAPIERPGKYLALGMNYAKHLEEAGRLGVAPPSSNTNQVWFNKQTTCISGPYDDIDPGVTQMLDYESELGVVMGERAKGVVAGQALAHVFGYFVANDVSARDWQRHTSTIMMGKSFDTHGPIGPWIVTADKIPDPQNLELRCDVNGEPRQGSNTRHMIHKITDRIEYLSTAFTLEPGDLLATGTPEGVGVGMEPPTFLQVGDVVRCEIDGIGAIENRVALPARVHRSY